MEQDLTCNVNKCGAQLTGQALVTACSHAICMDCASRHGFTSQGPYTCPVCRQPLNESETGRQLLRPSEEWKSVILCGLSPTVVMECAGRALSFWSYQVTNQILRQSQMNRNLQLHCVSLEREVESVWNQGNARISTLTAKIKDIELEEQGLRRKCEDLRRTLTEKSKKLEQAQELYNKLKQKVLLSQPANDPADVMGSRLGSNTDRYDLQGQNAGGIGPTTNYFPDDSRPSRRHSGSGSVDNWNKPMETQFLVPGTPASHMSIGEPGSRFSSMRDTLSNTLPAIPRSGRYTQSSRANNHATASNIGRTTSTSFTSTELRGSRRHDEPVVPRTSTIRRVGDPILRTSSHSFDSLHSFIDR
ncbi:hypothetical protein QR685DRAFT_570584 [Neurospora intermedia]|uniref:RING-type domain-containing protein n=1 Tax=Neurospora intermedia TaxID=5142 RepID=A0ABR3DGN8_NEUIN